MFFVEVAVIAPGFAFHLSSSIHRTTRVGSLLIALHGKEGIPSVYMCQIFAAQQMLAAKESDYAFVIDRSGKFLGILSAQKLSERQLAQSIISVMDDKSDICSPDSSVESLFPIAAAASHQIPVIDDDGKLLGQVETSAILNSMVRKKEEEYYNGIS